MRLKQIIAVTFILFLIISALYTNLNNQNSDTKNKDNIAYDFNLLSLKNENIQLSQYRGKPVIINFWATWCEPCENEMPVFEKFHQSYGEEIEILAVNMTSHEINEEHVSIFAEENNLSFNILLDKEGIYRHYKVLQMPTTFFINKKGEIVDIYLGELNYETLVKLSTKIN